MIHGEYKHSPQPGLNAYSCCAAVFEIKDDCQAPARGSSSWAIRPLIDEARFALAYSLVLSNAMHNERLACLTCRTHIRD